MYWRDEGYLLSKNNFDENSYIIEVFTLGHGKYSGIVYGGTSKKQKINFQIGNKILLNWKSRNENKSGYFNVELIKPISPLFFDDKKKSSSILAASSILKILLPERQVNENVYNSFEKMLDNLKSSYWITLYIYWELSLIKELGYEVNFLNNLDNNNSITINNKIFKVPKILFKNHEEKEFNNKDVMEALIFNKNLLMENFIIPHKLGFPLYRSLLEHYYN